MRTPAPAPIPARIPRETRVSIRTSRNRTGDVQKGNLTPRLPARQVGYCTLARSLCRSTRTGACLVLRPDFAYFSGSAAGQCWPGRAGPLAPWRLLGFGLCSPRRSALGSLFKFGVMSMRAPGPALPCPALPCPAVPVRCGRQAGRGGAGRSERGGQAGTRQMHLPFRLDSGCHPISCLRC